MRVLIVIPDFVVGGAELMARNLALALADQGCLVCVFGIRKFLDSARDEWFQDMFSHPNISVVEGEDAHVRSISAVCRTLWRLRKTYTQFRADIVHSHCELPDLAVALSLVGLRVVRVRTAHTSTYLKGRLPRLGPTIEKWMSRYAGFHSVVAVSDDIAARYDYGRVTKIYNPVFSESTFPARQDNLTRKIRPIVGIVGRICLVKGQLELLQSMLRRYGNPAVFPFELRFYGDGPDRPEIEKLLPCFSGCVRWMGMVADQDKIYAKMDALLVPSESEGLSSVMIEALGRGIPVLSFPVSGTVEVLERWQCGVIVQNTQEMLDVVEARTWGQVTEPARQEMLQLFSLQRSTEQHLDLFRTLLRC